MQELKVIEEIKDVIIYIEKKMDYLRTSRPTAVNLFNALDELSTVIHSKKSDGSKDNILQAIRTHAEFMLERDVRDNEAIGTHGANILLADNGNIDNNGNNGNKKIRMMTICNTGSLATAGYGTALGVARTLQKLHKLESITALETRPYNQGSRLTAFEILEEKMPNGTLICDSAAASFMRTKGADACVVGADRVCANGDTANKIGTYQLAVAAKEHGVPFYVASPFTTLDVHLEHGDKIEIEERSANELIDTSQAPKHMNVWNPGFDVTPAKYITGIITEKGVVLKDDNGNLNVADFVLKHQSDDYKDGPSSSKKPKLS